MVEEINKLSELVESVAKIGKNNPNRIVFRGEQRDYGASALVPLVYRGFIRNEDKIYRESQRFNDQEFSADLGVFDKLSRIQHYTAPTRLIDVSEDLFSAMYFAISEKKVKGKPLEDPHDAIIYVLEIDDSLTKYYDSDTVTVVSNLAKIPLHNTNSKSKHALLKDIRAHRDHARRFNVTDSAEYLLHEIKHEKPHFSNLIQPKHLTSIQFVLPKLTSNRIRSQKGAFLLFGMNPEDCQEPIRLLKDGNLVNPTKDVAHPVKNLHKFILKNVSIPDMQDELASLGIKKSFIYPEIDKVSEYLKSTYSDCDNACDVTG